MKISYNQLKKLVHFDVGHHTLGDILTNLGLEVEHVSPFSSIPGGLDGLIVGKVVEINQHPNANKLKLAKVDIGEQENLSIVCGAPNIDEGQYVIVAPVNTSIYPMDHEPVKIKKTKIRGIESAGMICSEAEVGISQAKDGIYVFDDTKEIYVGAEVKQFFEIETDYIYEIGLTPNRGDAASHIGVAKDLAAYFDTPVIFPETLDHTSINKLQNHSISIAVEDADACPLYCGIELEVTVKDSPTWLINKLKGIDVKPINNVVDVTNFVLHELGAPLHAFDMDKIKGGKIAVKKCPQNTPFITLDDKERKLDSNDLMICNASGPMCIAGIFGGIESGVTADTKKIFLECALFDSVHIRKTSTKHDLKTDASYRFERGVDIEMVVQSLLRASKLMIELCEGRVLSPIHKVEKKGLWKKRNIEVRYDYIDSMSGQKIDKQAIKSILYRLGFSILSDNEACLLLDVPHAKIDVSQPCDVVEEILRIYGYNRIDIPSKISYSKNNAAPTEKNALLLDISNKLCGQGFFEIKTNSISNKHYYENKDNLVEILNSANSDLNVLRQSLVYNSIEAVQYNVFRNNQDLKFFEFGKVFSKNNEHFTESELLSITMCGHTLPKQWNNVEKTVSLYTIKGVIHHILSSFGIRNYDYDFNVSEDFSFGLTLKDPKTNGTLSEFGLISDRIHTLFDIKNTPVFHGTISLHELLGCKKDLKFEPIPKSLGVRRDLSLYLDSSIQFGTLKNIALHVAPKLLKEVRIFDVYFDKKTNKTSYALSYLIHDEKKTLKDSKINHLMDKIMIEYEKTGHVEVRKS